MVYYLDSQKDTLVIQTVKKIASLVSINFQLLKGQETPKQGFYVFFDPYSYPVKGAHYSASSNIREVIRDFRLNHRWNNRLLLFVQENYFTDQEKELMGVKTTQSLINFFAFTKVSSRSYRSSLRLKFISSGLITESEHIIHDLKYGIDISMIERIQRFIGKLEAEQIVEYELVQSVRTHLMSMPAEVDVIQIRGFVEQINNQISNYFWG